MINQLIDGSEGMGSIFQVFFFSCVTKIKQCVKTTDYQPFKEKCSPRQKYTKLFVSEASLVSNFLFLMSPLLSAAFMEFVAGLSDKLHENRHREGRWHGGDADSQHGDEREEHFFNEKGPTVSEKDRFDTNGEPTDAR